MPSIMGCCSSKNAEEPEDVSPRYSEIGAHCLQSANAHIQVKYHYGSCWCFTNHLNGERKAMGEPKLNDNPADVQMHACAAGYFSCVTTQQLVASDVNEQYILVAMGSSSDAAALAIRMQSLQQVHAPWSCMCPHHTTLKCQERAFT